MEAPLSEEIFEVLSRNGVFYRQGPDDTARHYIDPATIKYLAEEIIKTIVVPILAAGAGAAFAEYIKTKFKKDNKKSLTTDDFIKLWKAMSFSLPSESNPVEQIKSKLQYHGWPKDEAEADAIQVVMLSIEHDLSSGKEKNEEE